MELGDGDDGDGDPRREERPAAARREGGEEERAVRQRVPGVEVAEQHGDRERQEQRRDQHRLGADDRAPGLALAMAARDLRPDVPEARGRAEAPQDEDHAVGQPRDEAHRLRDRRRVRVEELGRGRRAAGEHRGVVRALAGRERAGAVEQQREVEARPWRVLVPQGPADVRDAEPRDHPGDDPRGERAAEALGRRHGTNQPANIAVLRPTAGARTPPASTYRPPTRRRRRIHSYGNAGTAAARSTGSTRTGRPSRAARGDRDAPQRDGLRTNTNRNTANSRLARLTAWVNTIARAAVFDTRRRACRSRRRRGRSARRALQSPPPEPRDRREPRSSLRRRRGRRCRPRSPTGSRRPG